MINRYTTIGLLIIVAIISVYAGFLYHKAYKDSFKSIGVMPKNDEIVAVTVKGRDVIVANTKGVIKTTEMPRKGELQVGVTETGQIRVDTASPIQISYHLGLELTPTDVLPSLGVQWLQWHKIGLSTNISSKGVSLSLERDLYDFYPQFQNSFAGVFIRQNYDASQSVGLCFGVYF